MQWLQNIDIETTVLIFGITVFMVFLIRWHISDDSFDLKSVVMTNGQFSLSKFGQLMALLVSTWIILYQTRKGLLTDWLFTGYMIAWSGANLVNKYIDKPSANSATSTTNTTINTQQQAPLDYRSYRKQQ
jgi:hypothetical protein